jgi:MFS superfamily sulfate permease-like transporter
VYRLEARLFFANARYVKERVSEAVRGAESDTRWVVLDCEAVTQVDSTGMEGLDEMHDELARDGVTLVLGRVRDGLRRSLRDGGVLDTIGAENLHPTVAAAVSACVRADARASASSSPA